VPLLPLLNAVPSILSATQPTLVLLVYQYVSGVTTLVVPSEYVAVTVNLPPLLLNSFIVMLDGEMFRDVTVGVAANENVANIKVSEMNIVVKIHSLVNLFDNIIIDLLILK
jgi:hypothetical protein